MDKASKKGAFFCLKTKRDLFLLCFKTKRNLLANLFAAKASHKTKRDLFFLCLKTTRDLFFLCLKTFFLLYCFKTKRDYIVKTIRKDYNKNLLVCFVLNHPTRDSNAESPAPEADALSIRPAGQPYLYGQERVYIPSEWARLFHF
jgi:hypothetical protein